MSYGEPESASRAKITGVSFEISPQLNERLEQISSLHGVSKVDIVKRAFALLDVAVTAKDNNERLGVVNEHGKLIKEVTGLF